MQPDPLGRPPSGVVVPGPSVRTSLSDRPLADRRQPIPVGSGFRMPGWFVWCGSLLQVGDTYHLFCSRWPQATKFPQGYLTDSEIVRATSSRPEGPYEFQQVIVGGRGGGYWDGGMCHNPKVVRAGDRYVLYYNACAEGSALRQVGYAWADSIEGPWHRLDQPLPFGEDANNPAPLVRQDGSLLLVWRNRDLVLSVMRAAAFDAPYELLARDLVPRCRLEDPDLLCHEGQYHLVLEDNQGHLTGHERHGAHLVSDDGVTWTRHEPLRVYDHTLRFTDGSVIEAERRERPELFRDGAALKGHGLPTHLLTAVLRDNQSWCVIEPLG